MEDNNRDNVVDSSSVWIIKLHFFPLTLSNLMFSITWRLVTKFFNSFLIGLEGLVRYIIVAVRRLGKICYVAWYKVREKYFRKEAPHTAEYEVDEDDVPAGLMTRLYIHTEVIVKITSIESSDL